MPTEAYLSALGMTFDYEDVGEGGVGVLFALLVALIIVVSKYCLYCCF